MSKKTSTIVGIVVVIIIAIAIFVSQSPKSQTVPSGNQPAVSSTTQTDASVSGTVSTSYTLADVSKHNDKTSCWTAINGNVYDVTSWITQHPGGQEAILSLCGTDGSAAFNGQHGGQARPEQELASFKIGALAN